MALLQSFTDPRDWFLQIDRPKNPFLRGNPTYSSRVFCATLSSPSLRRFAHLTNLRAACRDRPRSGLGLVLGRNLAQGSRAGEQKSGVARAFIELSEV